ALRHSLENWRTPTVTAADDENTDFGEDLLDDGLRAGPVVVVLGDDAVARAAHGLVRSFERGETVPVQCLQAPLPLPQTAEAGPARLHFRGQDYFLNEPSFILGSQPGCQLVLSCDD